MRIFSILVLATAMISSAAVLAGGPPATAAAGPATRAAPTTRAVPATTAATNPSATAKEVKATIDEAVGLMDKKDYGAVIDRFVPPEQLKKMKANADEYKKTKESFAADMADVFSKALKECQAEEPTVVSETEATYKTTEGPPMHLTKVDGKWYIE